MQNKKYLYPTACIVIILDQLIKFIISHHLKLYQEIKIIKNFFSLYYVRNTGAAFSILENNTTFLIVISVLFIVVLHNFIKKESNISIINQIAIGLILGGVFGNLIDRIVYQSVIDYLLFLIGNHSFPVFNLADMGITIGSIILLINILIETKQEKEIGDYKMSDKEKFLNYYKAEKEKLDKVINDYNKELTSNDKILNENLKLFRDLNTNGKLIRGILVKLGYNLLKEDLDYANDLALSYEVLQTSILIHDDIIDKDDKRRDTDTIHYANYKRYEKEITNKKELKDLSNSIALCMGDYGLYLSNQIIAEKYAKDKNLSKILSCFNNTFLKTLHGELLDTILPHKSKTDTIEIEDLKESIMNIYRLKTSYYTIIGPLTIGLYLAGGNKEQASELEKIGEKIGIAFQIQDDIIGIYSDNSGKVTGSDIREFKQTIMYYHICTTKYKKELLKYYGTNKLTPEKITKVRELFEISGSKEYATNMMNNLYDESINDINNIEWINEDKKVLLKGFIEYLKSRKK